MQETWIVEDRRTVENKIYFNQPFELIIGDKSQRVTDRAELRSEQILSTLTDEIDPFGVPKASVVGWSARLFINGKLFATVRQEDGHEPIKLDPVGHRLVLDKNCVQLMSPQPKP